MKRWFHIAFLSCIVAFLACNRPVETQNFASPPPADPALQAIDSLMWQRPDSALACLLPWFDTSCRDGVHTVSASCDRHYAHLLLAELLYKNDYGQNNRDDLLMAVAYYDSLTSTLNDIPHAPWRHGGLDPQSPDLNASIAFLDARAHYINGVGYYERDSLVEACKEYLKALEVMEGRFEERNFVGRNAQFMALIYTRLTVLFSDLYLHEQAIYFGKASLYFFRKFGASPRHIAWILDEIGTQYDMMDSNDTACIYYYDALNILPDTNNITYRDVVTHLAFLTYKMGGASSASLNLLKEIAIKAESDKEFYSRCMNIGEVFYHERLFDSAWFYLNRVFYESHNINSRRQAAEWLVAICKAQGRVSETLEYAVFLVPFANHEENQSATKSQLTEQYKNYVQRKQECLHQQERMKNIEWTLTIVGCLLVLLSSMAILYHKNRKKKQHLEMQIETERQAHKMQQKALSGRLKKSNEALHNALKQLDDNPANNEFQIEPQPVQNYISFVETPICIHILETVRQQKFKSKIDFLIYKEYALQKRQLLALRVAADEKMGCFTIRLKKHFPCLTEEDITYCCLYLLDITDADIAALMQKAYPTVRERKRKIKRIVGVENNLSFTLRNLPN